MKGFVFVQGSEIALRFFHNNVFARLEELYDIVYVILRPTSKKRKDAGIDDVLERIGPNASIEWVDHQPKRAREWETLFHISSIHHEAKSPSFAVRHAEDYRHRENYDELRKCAAPGAYGGYKEDLERRLGFNPEIMRVTLKHKPDFFILPSVLQDRLTDDTLQLADWFSIPTLLLLAGWDNLSSKGILQHQPAMVGVFGEQTRRHAITIQGVAPECIAVVGAAQYEDFSLGKWGTQAECRQQLDLGDGPERIILFAGTFRLFDETALLLQLEAKIEEGALPAMRILYRPHPQRTPRESEVSFFDYDWKHVLLDPAMEEFYVAHKEGNDAAPTNYFERFDYLPRLYRAVDAVICPLSSVMLEAIMFGVPVQAVAFSDGKHSWSADKVARMTHFKEFYKIPDLVVTRVADRFIDDVARVLNMVGDTEVSDRLQVASRQFVYRDERSYAERVADTTATMMERVTTPPEYARGAIKMAGLRKLAGRSLKRMQDTIRGRR